MQDRFKRIVLVGYMYSGKSTLGRHIAAKLGYEFFDTDKEIENKFRYTVLSFFKNFGEDVFRKAEHEMLKELLLKDNVVIATGGGTPCFYGNMEYINNMSLSVYLQMNVGQIMSRHAKSKVKRPLLEGKQEDEIKQYITETLVQREQFYLKADIVADAFNPDAAKITEDIKKLQKNENLIY